MKSGHQPPSTTDETGPKPTQPYPKLPKPTWTPTQTYPNLLNRLDIHLLEKINNTAKQLRNEAIPVEAERTGVTELEYVLGMLLELELVDMDHVSQVTNKPRFSLAFLASRAAFAHPCTTAAAQAPPNDAPTLSTRSPSSEPPVKTLTCKVPLFF